jgi:hypothetical protein
MRTAVRTGAALGAMVAAAALLLLIRCGSTTIDATDIPASVSIGPPDDPHVHIEAPFTMLPTPTATPIA